MVPFKSIRAWEQETGTKYHDLSPLSKHNVRQGLSTDRILSNSISLVNEQGKHRGDEEASQVRKRENAEFLTLWDQCGPANPSRLIGDLSNSSRLNRSALPIKSREMKGKFE